MNPHTGVYLFDHDMPIFGGQVPWHCADIPYIFHNTEVVPTMGEPATAQLQERLFGSLMAFARTGDPNHETLPAWPACTPEREFVMVFDDENHVEVNFDHELIPLLTRRMLPLFEKQREERMKKVQH